MIKIAVLADIHANLPAFQAVLADVHNRGCDRIYHAGDLISIGPYPAEVVDLAQSVNLWSVKGNHESWVERGLPLDPIPGMSDEELLHQHWTHSRLDKPRRDFIKAMPFKKSETIEGVNVSIVHYALDHTGKAFKPTDYPQTDIDIMSSFNNVEGHLICFGHLHRRQINRIYEGCYYLNPGSAGCNHKNIAPYAIVTLQDGSISVEQLEIPYDRTELLAEYDRLEIPARETIKKIFYGVENK
jgi:putative phosphoesterase